MTPRPNAAADWRHHLGKRVRSRCLRPVGSVQIQACPHERQHRERSHRGQGHRDPISPSSRLTSARQRAQRQPPAACLCFVASSCGYAAGSASRTPFFSSLKLLQNLIVAAAAASNPPFNKGSQVSDSTQKTTANAITICNFKLHSWFISALFAQLVFSQRTADPSKPGCTVGVARC